MNTPTDKTTMATTVTDLRQTPLGQLSATKLADRLYRADQRKVAVAAFYAAV